tara:strand:- start:268 stop:417 length:150 start_codon:yes stop_codon:yes gene_type:complete
MSETIKTYKITGSFEYEIKAETEQDAKEIVEDNLADLNNICHEIEEVGQ